MILYKTVATSNPPIWYNTNKLFTAILPLMSWSLQVNGAGAFSVPCGEVPIGTQIPIVDNFLEVCVALQNLLADHGLNNATRTNVAEFSDAMITNCAAGLSITNQLYAVENAGQQLFQILSNFSSNRTEFFGAVAGGDFSLAQNLLGISPTAPGTTSLPPTNVPTTSSPTDPTPPNAFNPELYNESSLLLPAVVVLGVTTIVAVGAFGVRQAAEERLSRLESAAADRAPQNSLNELDGELTAVHKEPINDLSSGLADKIQGAGTHASAANTAKTIVESLLKYLLEIKTTSENGGQSVVFDDSDMDTLREAVDKVAWAAPVNLGDKVKARSEFIAPSLGFALGLCGFIASWPVGFATLVACSVLGGVVGYRSMDVNLEPAFEHISSKLTGSESADVAVVVNAS